MNSFYKNSQDLKDEFSKKFRTQLKRAYGKIPSASFIAREFNLRAKNTTPITQESARRWVRGLCLPEDHRLKVLVTWLKIDLNKIFNPDNQEKNSAQLIEILENVDHKQIDLVIKVMSMLSEYTK